METLYKDVKSVPSYGAKITDFLRQHDVHGVYRRIVKRKFPRRKVIARFPFDLFMADLIEYPNRKMVYTNNGYRFILLLIDCFTKMIYVAPMKRKSKEWTSDAFESIFKNFDQFPVHLVTDGGLEFFNSQVAKIFDNYGINHYKTQTKTKWKASIAERAIRTIKEKLEKYFHITGKRKWIDAIDQIVSNYNNTPHSSHGYPPNEVVNRPRGEIYKLLYPNKSLKIQCRLKKGDLVRILREKRLFEKGYTPKWSKEIYKISDIRQSNTMCWYKVRSIDDKPLKGIWYYYQLNLVSSHVYTSELDPSSIESNSNKGT